MTEKNKERLEKCAARLAMAKAIVFVLGEGAPAWNVRQVGSSNVLELETCGRRYHMTVLGGEKV